MKYKRYYVLFPNSMVSARRLAELYGLNPRKCFLAGTPLFGVNRNLVYLVMPLGEPEDYEKKRLEIAEFEAKSQIHS